MFLTKIFDLSSVVVVLETDDAASTVCCRKSNGSDLAGPDPGMSSDIVAYPLRVIHAARLRGDTRRKRYWKPG